MQFMNGPSNRIWHPLCLKDKILYTAEKEDYLMWRQILLLKVKFWLSAHTVIGISQKIGSTDM